MEITLKKHVRKISSENNHALPPPQKKRHMVIMIYEPNSRWKHLRPANFSQTNPWKSKAKPNVLTVGSGFSFLGISLPETNISPLKK